MTSVEEAIEAELGGAGRLEIVRELDKHVPDSDRMAALPASAPQDDVTEHRYVVIPCDLFLAFDTIRPRPDDRDIPRNPVDADVQKAAEHQPKQKKCCGKEPGMSGEIKDVQGQYSRFDGSCWGDYTQSN